MCSSSGNSGGVFSIDPSLGIIRLAQSLDRGPSVHGGEYLVLVRATDHAPLPRSASLPVRITVALARDALPTFTRAAPRVSADLLRRTDAATVVELSEWAIRGTAVAIVAATAPRTALYYEIIGGNSGGPEASGVLFAVTPSSGVVSLAGQLDREACAWYNLTITATNTVRDREACAWYNLTITATSMVRDREACAWYNLTITATNMVRGITK